MRNNFRYILTTVAVLFLAASCSEKYEIKKAASEDVFLAVESILTDMPGIQTVKLTESIPYTGIARPKGVSGAVVTISDVQDNIPVRFVEDPENPGVYNSPEMFCGLTGHTYNLKIERETEDGVKVYEASSTMMECGFNLEKIDYKYTDSLIDSLWTVGVWGSDNSLPDNYLVLPAVNGFSYPIDYTIPLEDKYFNGAVVAGYPITVLEQTWTNVKVYGPCAKPLETGDVISLLLYDMPRDFYDYMRVLVESASAVSIPIISSQPANLPTNLRGENVLGYFTACPISIATCVVDDPYRTKFLDEIAAGL